MAGSEKQMAIVAPPEPSGPPSMGNFSVKKQRKGSIGISKYNIEKSIKKVYYSFFACRRMRTECCFH
jgi:hypothetical protein